MTAQFSGLVLVDGVVNHILRAQTSNNFMVKGTQAVILILPNIRPKLLYKKP